MALIVVLLAGLTGLLTAVGDLDGLLARKELAGVSVSLAVMDVDTGEVLVARRADTPRVPASNMKLVTTAAAVQTLGPDFHFTTRFLAESVPDSDGVLGGDLVVLGGGDPCLTEELLSELAGQPPAQALAALVTQAGVRRIEGRLVLDDGFFDEQGLHPDWPAEDLAYAYAAPIGALSIDGNCLTLQLSGRESRPRARLLTEAVGYRIDNDLKRAGRPRDYRVTGLRPNRSGEVRVYGAIGQGVGDQTIRVPVRDSALLFGRSLVGALQDLDVQVTGGLAVVRGGAAALEDPVELAVFSSPLANAVILANKESDNTIAEHLYKAVGAVAVGDGSFSGGARGVSRFLAEAAVDVDGLELRDGSGLSPANRLTARALVEVLRHMAREESPGRDLFLRSLPVAGRDGSLHERLDEAAYRGRVRAKTGFIGGASALSGYVETRGERTLAFSILFNGVRRGRNAYMKAAQDDICRWLVDTW